MSEANVLQTWPGRSVATFATLRGAGNPVAVAAWLAVTAAGVAVGLAVDGPWWALCGWIIGVLVAVVVARRR